jgi:hypothetical protein
VAEARMPSKSCVRATVPRVRIPPSPHGLSIFTVPLVLGGGKKLFADGSAPRSFTLTRSRVSSTGLLIGHYERDGEIKIKIGDTAMPSPSAREIARQERMKRED